MLVCKYYMYYGPQRHGGGYVMKKSVFRTLLGAITLVQGLMLSGVAMAAVPPPPVIQMQGIPDGVFNNLSEPVCRECHVNRPDGIPIEDGLLVDRHHLKAILQMTIPPDSDRPNPDPDGDGVVNTTYECLSCHVLEFDPNLGDFVLVNNFRDCMNCHHQDNEATVHHLTQLAADQDCQACHQSLINNPLDGHSIPTYSPSLITPWPSGKPNADGSIVSSAGTSPGNCNFCHNTANGAPGNPANSLEDTWINTVVSVYQNMETHHSTGLAVTDSTRCSWCHDAAVTGTAYEIRQCEACHGVTSLHAITNDSNGDGNVMPGQEVAGYSHTGAQADCWGCHGSNGTVMSTMSAPGGAAAIPALHSMSIASVEAGSDATLSLGGMNFTNYVKNPWTGEYSYLLESVVRLIDSAGNATDYIPTSISSDSLEVVIPGSVPAGKYKISVTKYNKSSNPMALTITPGVTISSAACDQGTLTVTGSGFGMHLDASDSGTSVTMGGVTGDVTAWSDNEITAEFASCGNNVLVNTVFDSALSPVN